MQKILAFSLIAIFAVGLFSCSDDSTSPSVDTTYLFPLKVGNTWTYLTYTYHTSAPNDIYYKDTTTYSINALVVSNGITWYCLVDNNTEEGTMLTNKSDGLWWIYDSYDTLAPIPLLAYKYPTFVGDTLKSADEEDFMVTYAMAQNVRIGNVNYNNCILYDSPDKGPGTVRQQVYMMPGIGKIKQISSQIISFEGNPSDTLIRVTELQSYHLEK